MRMLLAILVLGMFGSCQNTPKLNNEYSKLETYCYCIQSSSNDAGGFYIVHGCSGHQILPKNFAIKNLLYYESTDINIIKSVEKLFFSTPHLSEPAKYSSDPAFMIILKRGDGSGDTLMFHNEAAFFLNEKTFLKYDINVMDTLRRIMGKEKIECLQ